MNRTLIGLWLLLLTGCAGGFGTLAPAPEPEVVAEVPPPSPAELRASAGRLPGVEIAAGEPLTLRYPGQVLFSEGAALPLAGGVEMLDPLAAWLAAAGQSRWRGTVRAVTGVSPEYDRQLAEKRAELLGRYFANRGIPAERLKLQAEGGAGAPFELELRD